MSEEISVLNILTEIKKSNDESHDSIIKTVDALCGTITEHNGRLRKVEEWQNKMIGAIAILGLIVSGLIFPILIKTASTIVQAKINPATAGQ